jgi:serine/threonine protein kinase
MDYYEGDLQGVITVFGLQQQKLHPLIALMWSMELVRGMKICHENDIIHRDLKPENGGLSYPSFLNGYQ